MRRPAFKRVIAALLAVGIILPMLALITPVSFAANEGYSETGDWKNSNPNAPTDYAYSIAVVGDTQSIVKKDLTNGTNYMASIYSWLANNASAKKLQYVLGVGDITEYTENFDSSFNGAWSYADEWAHAKAAITLLDNKVPYSLCRGGGHDTASKFNEYFASHSYYTGNLSGSYSANDVTSTYSTFEVGEVKYLLFALDWNPSDAVLNWAGEIIKANPDRRVIITTHSYLNKDGTLHGSSSSHTAVPSTNNGVDIYEKLVSKYDNIQLVICGHDPSANLVYRQDARESGSVVTSLLVDPQTFDSQNNAETGMVCMLYFSEDGNEVNVEWYSTVRDQYYKSSNQFSLNLAEMVTDEGFITKYGVVPSKYADADAYPFLTFVDGEFTDLGAYDPFNYASGTLERALRKLTADQEVVIIARKDYTVIDGSNGYLMTNYTAAKVTIDLCGHTVNAKTANPTNTFASNATQSINTDFTIKNGKIILGKGLLSVSTGGADKVQSFTFENLDITSHNKELLIFNQYKTAGTVYINFIDCDIVSATNDNNNFSAYRAGNSGDKDSLMNVTTTVKGGSVTYAKSDISNLVQEYNGSKVVFLPGDDGELTRVIVPTGTSVGEKTYKGENGSALALVKTGASSAGDEYTLMATAGGGIETPYGTIPMEYASVVDYPFIAFAGGEVVKAGNNIFIDESGSFERGIRNLDKGGKGITIILRSDFTLPKAGYFLTNYAKEKITIDLCGHTVTNPYSENLFSSNGTQTHETSVHVKNGTLLLEKCLYSVSTHANAPGKVQNITFESLNVSTTYNHVIFHNTSASKGTIYINYINCNISITNTNANIFQAGKSATDTNIVTHITVKGGSLTTPKFTTDRFVIEHNGGTVTFLPDDNGNYITVNVKGSGASTVGNEYRTSVGNMTLNKVGSEGGYTVYTLRDAAKTVKPKASLTMYSGFVYNMYIPAESFIASITVNGTTYTDLASLPTKEIGGKLYYRVTESISVVKAADTVSLSVQTTAHKQSWELDVIDYAEALILGEYTAVEKTLARDILAYVRAAYLYKNGDDAAKVSSRVEEIIGDEYSVSPDTSDEVRMSTEGLDAAGLLLKDSPILVFYPELNDNGTTKYELSAYSFTASGTVLTSEPVSIDGKTAILVYTYAYAVTDTVGYTVAGTDISGEYNLAAYLANAQTSGEQNLIDLVLALWQYSDAAMAYRAQELAK